MDALDWATRDQDLLLDLAHVGARHILTSRLPSPEAQSALARLCHQHEVSDHHLNLLGEYLSQIPLSYDASQQHFVEFTSPSHPVSLLAVLVPALLGRKDSCVANFLKSLHQELTTVSKPAAATLTAASTTASASTGHGIVHYRYLLSLMAVCASAIMSYSSSSYLDPIITRSLPVPTSSSESSSFSRILTLRIRSQVWIKAYDPSGWPSLVEKGIYQFKQEEKEEGEIEKKKIPQDEESLQQKNCSDNAKPSQQEVQDALQIYTYSLEYLKVALSKNSQNINISSQNLSETLAHHARTLQTIDSVDALVDAVKLCTVLVCANGSTDQMNNWRQTLCYLTGEFVNSTCSDPRIQDAALNSLSLLIRSSNDATMAESLVQHLRRIAQNPSPSVSSNEQTLYEVAQTLACALECLSPSQDDIPLSTAYALLNYSASKYVSSAAPSLNYINFNNSGPTTTTTTTNGNNTSSNSSEQQQYLQQTTPLSKRASSISITTIVTHLTLHFHKPDMTGLVISMLLQRLRSSTSTLAVAEPDPEDENVVVTLITNLAHLATEATELELTDIVRSLSDVSHSTHSLHIHHNASSETSKVQDAILSAQTRIASRIAQMSESKPEFRDIYLRELLALFVDRTIRFHPQTQPTEKHRQLVTLIPVIDALITNVDIDSETPDDLVTLFRDFWFIIVLFGLCNQPSTEASSSFKNPAMTSNQYDALKRIAAKTPCLVRSTASDYLERDLEYNSVLRKHSKTLPSSIDNQRHELALALPQNAGQVRHLSYPQTVFFLAVLKLESMRAQLLKPSTMLSYFNNQGINSTPLFTLLASIADHVNETFRRALNHQVVHHSIDSAVYTEIKNILVMCCRPSPQVRKVSVRYVSSIVNAFPSLFCHAIVVDTALEILTLLRRSCEAAYNDQYSPVFKFHSRKTPFYLELPDDYTTRNDILTEMSSSVRSWFSVTISRAPLEMRGLLLAYVDHPNDETFERDPLDSEMGKSVALDLARTLPGTSKQADLPSWGGWKPDTTASFVSSFGTRKHFAGQVVGLVMANKVKGQQDHKPLMSLDGTLHVSQVTDDDRESHPISLLKNDMRIMGENAAKSPPKVTEIRQLLYRAASALIGAEKPDHELLNRLVKLPITIFSPSAVSIATEVWAWLIDQRVELEERLMTEISLVWHWSMRKRKGLFSKVLNQKNPLEQEAEYSPTDRDAIDMTYRAARRLFSPHHSLIDFLSSRFQAYRYSNPKLLLVARKLVHHTCAQVDKWSTHPLARELWNKVILFGFAILQGSSTEAVVEYSFRDSIYRAAFAWFENRTCWSFGSNRMQLEADIKSSQELYNVIKVDPPSIDFWASAHTFEPSKGLPYFGRRMTARQATARQKGRQTLLLVLLESEIERLHIWLSPTSTSKHLNTIKTPISKGMSEQNWSRLVHVAWDVSPCLAIRLPERFKQPYIANQVSTCVKKQPDRAIDVPEGLQFLYHNFVNTPKDPKHLYRYRHVLFWAPVPPVSALRFFEPSYGNDPLLLQYAMRVMEQHPVPVTFFYTPQVVQTLRSDSLGYVERFIFETANISQLFCHQIIWNMKANYYRDDNAEVPDPMKPMFERTVEMVVASLSGEAKTFYEREFGFFDTVTSISKKLQPYVKKSKPEKKAKIDEEMSKIVVDAGVYLPSNPDGVVIDIDRKSGRPLQSHAKTPFMATFKLHKEYKKQIEPGLLDEENEIGNISGDGFDVWQSAIFKVGDDTRQDMLALQIIAQCKNIFMDLGLHLQVVPYRVIATGPGSGLIDVIPNSTSRDEMGRAKINDLAAFFVGKFGSPESTAFQEARVNFIQSMAAYSLLCYIIQIKDRHNGNIMIDGTGRICHIDFGFLFDIDKWDRLTDLRNYKGVKFEPNSFKLNHEMVVLMGGPRSAGYQMFRELTVKAFLACRPYVDEIVSTAHLMIGTGLPSFRGEGTIKRLRDRFRPDLNEREAAEYMVSVIDDAFENARSTMYDRFQNLQNGIPY